MNKDIYMKINAVIDMAEELLKIKEDLPTSVYWDSEEQKQMEIANDQKTINQVAIWVGAQ